MYAIPAAAEPSLHISSEAAFTLSEVAIDIQFIPEDLPAAIEADFTYPDSLDVLGFPHTFPDETITVGWYRIVLPPISWDDAVLPGFSLGFTADFDEVYLNGRFVGSNNGFDTSRTNEAYGINRLYALPADSIHQSDRNILAIRIASDVSWLGRIDKDPVIGNYSYFLQRRTRSDVFKLMLSAGYIITGLLFILLYARRRSAPEHLFFGLFCISVALYFFFHNDTVLFMFNTHTWFTRLEYIFLWTAIPMFMLFIMRYYRRDVHWYHMVYLTFIGLCVVFALLSPGTFQLAQLNFNLMQYSWLFPFGVILWVLGHELRRSKTARSIFIGTIILFTGVLIDIWISRSDLVGLDALSVSQYFLFPYILVIAIIVLKQLVNLYAEVERLYTLATRDGLTGVAIRTHALQLFDRLLSMSRRHERPMSVLMADLDNFKQINDDYGHPAGDVVLQRVGQLLVHALRHEDLVGRVGGEEFLIVLPETDTHGAKIIAERIRNAVVRLKFEELGNKGITISIGVAAYPDAGNDRKSLTQAADNALYAAKHAGRNRVCITGSGTDAS